MDNPSEFNFIELNTGTVIQGCTIKRYKEKNESNYLVLECLTCKQIGYYENEYEVGKAVGLHFANKEMYPIL